MLRRGIPYGKECRRKAYTYGDHDRVFIVHILKLVLNSCKNSIFA